MREHTVTSHSKLHSTTLNYYKNSRGVYSWCVCLPTPGHLINKGPKTNHPDWVGHVSKVATGDGLWKVGSSECWCENCGDLDLVWLQLQHSTPLFLFFNSLLFLMSLRRAPRFPCVVVVVVVYLNLLPSGPFPLYLETCRCLLVVQQRKWLTCGIELKSTSSIVCYYFLHRDICLFFSSLFTLFIVSSSLISCVYTPQNIKKMWSELCHKRYITRNLQLDWSGG